MLRHAAAAGAALVAAAVVLYLPATDLQLAGDDYQWVQHARRALHRPALLLADLDTFYRPASTWTLAADHLAWGFRPRGFHLTNVLLHGLCAAALALAGRRLGLPLAAATGAAVLWLASPLTSEPAIAVAIRFEDLLLLAWLLLALAWPRTGGAWTRRRVAAAAAAAVLAAACKETWVMTFALAAALAAGVRRAPLRAMARSALPFAAGAAVYGTAYFLAFPSDKGYFDVSLQPLAKLPHMLASFLALESLTPAGFVVSWRGALATAATLAMIAAAWRRRSPAGLFGAALLLAPLAPTLLVPYLPSRYVTIPFAGFVLLAAATLAEATAEWPARRRGLAWAAGAAAVLLFGAAGWAGVRAELADAARVSQAHRRLIEEAGEVAAAMPLDRPVAVIRAESVNPFVDIVRAPLGLQKLYYVRHPDPYGLIDAAALFEWAIARPHVLLARADDGDTRFAGQPGALLLHHADGFSWIDRTSPDAAAEAARWRAQGLPVRWVVRWSAR
jgi:hypothetical protein